MKEPQLARGLRINLLCLAGVAIGILAVFTTWIQVSPESALWDVNADIGHPPLVVPLRGDWSSIDMIREQSGVFGHQQGDVLAEEIFRTVGVVPFVALFAVGSIVSLMTPAGGVLQVMGLVGFYSKFYPVSSIQVEHLRSLGAPLLTLSL